MTAAPAVPAAALRLLLEQGFDSTSVDQLAAAAGISRSTFFRRFGSKEDMVFADQELVLSRVGEVLAGGGSPGPAVAAAALAVFDHHTAQREAALLRHRLLQKVPALRDRELVSTHRYEHAFRTFLGRALGGVEHDAGRRAATTAFAAAVVAVHNDHLRRWLRTPAETIRPELEARLDELCGLFGPWLAGQVPGQAGAPAEPQGTPGRPAVVVAVLDPGAGTESILQAVREALG
ncbi:TetR family transcriptional regulator [Zafaria cholistanensis]|uniref:TetR family transcriptional regulator n=1 Tax=Zafaria cholistanensis TaxID=1682741 RepID=A0A5A7NU03_9MICC|nr:TetR family transcriptional regulator [Zafaria cholistanensis]GER24273.1 TetR family transcriptional regulator [Zafaria cholistanensis]